MRPSLFNSNNIRSSAVTVRAPQSRQARVPIPGLQEDKSLAYAEQFGRVLVNSAQRVREKRDKFLENEAVLEYSDFTRNLFFGFDKEDGTHVKGFQGLTGVDAVDASGQYQKDIEGKLREIMGRLSPSQRQGALLRMANIRSVALNRGATHHVQQQKVADQQALFVEAEDIKKELTVDPVRAWSSKNGLPSMVEQHVAKYPDPKEREKILGDMARYTVFGAYNNAPVLPGKSVAESRYLASKAAFDSIKSRIPSDTRQYLNHGLIQKADHLKAEIAAENKAALQRQRLVIDTNASGELINLMGTPGSGGTIAKFVDGLYKVNAGTKDGGAKVVQDSLETALYHTALSSDTGVQAAQEVFDSMVKGGIKLDGNTALRLETFMGLELPKKIRDFRNQRDIQRMEIFQDDIKAVESMEQATALVERYNTGNPLFKNSNAFSKAVFGEYERKLKAVDEKNEQIRKDNAALAEGIMASVEGATADSISTFRDQVKAGTLDIKYLTLAQNQLLGADKVSKAIRATNGYKQAYSVVKGLEAANFFDPEVSADDEVTTPTNTINAGKALTDLFKWAREQFKAGNTNPDYGKWLEEYQANFTHNNPTSKSYWNPFNPVGTINPSHPVLAGKLFKPVFEWASGESSIMDEVAP